MSEGGIQKSVVVFGAALSCLEKCRRADICFQLMDRMREEGIAPNVHIFNCAISACARCNLWEKGYDLFQSMDTAKVARDVVTYNAVLDAVCSQVRLGRTLFEEGIMKGFYARVSRLAKNWFELDLHFMSLGGGEIGLGWWFEECLVPYLSDPEKLSEIKSISIVTGYGKTRTRGRRQGDDGMRKRVKAMLTYMEIVEMEQPNLGRIHIDMEAFVATVKKNGGKIIFDLDGYRAWKDAETTINVVPDVEQKIRPRYRPKYPGSNGPPFERIETESTSPEYRLENLKAGHGPDHFDQGRLIRRGPQKNEFDRGGDGRDTRLPRDEPNGFQGGRGAYDDRGRGSPRDRDDNRRSHGDSDRDSGNMRRGRQTPGDRYNRNALDDIARDGPGQRHGAPIGTINGRQGNTARNDRDSSFSGHDHRSNRVHSGRSDDQYGRRHPDEAGLRGDHDRSQGSSPGGRMGRMNGRFEEPRGRPLDANSSETNLKRGFDNHERSHPPQTRGYDLEPDRQRRRLS
jgi:pentatricopeptide repeat protein